MEGPPVSSEDNSDKKEKKKDKKSTGAENRLGAVAVTPKSRAGERPKIQSERSWSLLSDHKEGTEEPAHESKPGSFTESAETSETDALQEHLSPDEVQYAEHEIVEAHRAAEAEAETPNHSPEDSELAAQAVESFRDKVVNEAKNAEQAFAEVMSEIGAEDEPTPEPGISEAEPDHDAVHEFGADTIRIEHAAEMPVDEDEEADPTAPPPPAHAGAGGSPPRRPPTPLVPVATPGWPRGSGYYNLNSFAAGSGFGAARSEYIPAHDELSLRTIPGGIVGYLIGRRRGRAKAEKKLVPVQKKLEKQVKHLQQDIKFKEQQIRQFANERRRNHSPSVSSIIERQVAAPKHTERAETTRSTRAAAPEARQLHGKQGAPEHIGHMLIEAQSAQKQTREKQPPEQLKTDKNIETLSRAELLSLSEKITIDGSSLRQVFETHLIGERGLRRLIGEHLRGGDVKKALRREVMEREIDFERDPVMRDHAPQDAGGGASSPVTLDGLLQRAGAVPLGEAEEVAFLKARAAYESTQEQSRQKHRRLVDMSLAAIIAVLVGVVFVLFFSRG